MKLTPEDPVLIISDLHLGHRACRIHDPAALEPLFKPFRTVIFNGDTAEMRTPEDRLVGRNLAAELGRACHRSGCKALFLNGNHDPSISEVNHLDLHGGMLLVTHGDVLFLGVAPWSRQAKHYLSAHRHFLGELGGDAYVNFEKRMLATKRASIYLQMREAPLTRDRGGMPGIRTVANQFWPPWRPFKILHAWWRTPGLAAAMTALFRPEARFTIIGHTHYPGIWRRAGRVVINTGSFLSYMGALAVIIENNRLQVRSLRYCGNNVCLGKLKAAYPLSVEPVAHGADARS